MSSSSCITVAHERRDGALNSLDFWRFIAQFPAAGAGSHLSKETVRNGLVHTVRYPSLLEDYLMLSRQSLLCRRCVRRIARPVIPFSDNLKNNLRSISPSEIQSFRGYRTERKQGREHTVIESINAFHSNILSSTTTRVHERLPAIALLGAG